MEIIKEKLQPAKLLISEFETIYEQYYKRIYNYCFYCTSNHHNAEDLTSIVFERVLSKYHLYDEGKSLFEIWIFKIARNIVIDYHRANRRNKSSSIEEIQDEISDDGNTLETNVISNELHVYLTQALSCLPDKEKNIVIHKYISRLKSKEIADIMGITENSVGVILHRALKKLQKILIKRGVDLNDTI